MSDVVHLTTKDRQPITVESADGARNSPRLPSASADYSFADMGTDYEYFTPALITLAGGFDRDVVAEFVKHQTAGDPYLDPFAIDYDGEPFFVIPKTPQAPTLPEVEWSRRLYAIHRSVWFKCRDWINGIAFVNPADKSYTRLCFYEIELIDPIAARRPGVITQVPRFPVTVFAVSSTKRFSYLDANVPGPPKLVHEGPRQDTLIEAGHAGATEPDPHSLHKFKKRRNRT